MPDFYKEKMLVSVFMAPPASMYYNPVKAFRVLAIKENRKLIVDTLDLLHMWNVMPYNFINTHAGYVVC